jgi:oligopeptidase B
VTDDYAWLKDARWQEVLRDPAILDPDIRKYLEAENDYTESLLGHTAPLQKKLVAEMRGRIKEDDFQRALAGWPVRLLTEIPRGRPA